MAYQPSTEYLKTQVMTASPEMLQLLLWDGALRFAEQGRDAILRQDMEGSHKALVRAQKIIVEISTALRREVDPDLCGKLAALYNFMYRRLVEANLQKNPAPLDEALKLMKHQRETWVMLMEKLAAQRTAEAQAAGKENGAATTPAVNAAPTGMRTGTTGRLRGYGGAALPGASGRTAGLSVQG
jgi:flagellar secretion chaperone FliS